MTEESPRALGDPGPTLDLVPVVVPTDDDSDGRTGTVPFDQVSIVGRTRGWLLVRDLRDRSLVLTAKDGRFAAWRRRKTKTPTAAEVERLRESLERVGGYAPDPTPGRPDRYAR